MVTATSTNTLGFIIWTVALTIVGWLSAVVHSFLKRRKIEKRGAFSFAIRESLTSGLLMLAGVAILTAGLWAICVVVTVYRDHQRLVASNSDLSRKIQGLNDVAQHKEEMDRKVLEAQSKADNWQQAYAGISKGERVPDRAVSAEETDRLHTALANYAEHSGDRKYSTVRIAPAFYEDRESTNLALHLLRVFKDSHWNAQWEKEHSKPLETSFNYSTPVGVAIYSDDPHNEATWIMWMLKDVGVDSYVAEDVPAGFKGTLICVGYKQNQEMIQP
jgi:hypothetical protein